MKKQYIEPFVYIEDAKAYLTILAGSDPPASGVKGFMLENDLGLEPAVKGGDYKLTDPMYEPFIEGE